MAGASAPGADTWVVVGLGEKQVKGKLASGTTLALGALAHFAFAANAVQLFDVPSGRRLD